MKSSVSALSVCCLLSAAPCGAQCTPVLLSRTSLPVNAVETVDATRILVARLGRVELYNTSNPAAPTLTGGAVFPADSSFVDRMRASATTAWMRTIDPNNQSTMRIYSISGPAPSLLQEWPMGNPGRNGWDCAGNIVYTVSVDTGRMEITDYGAGFFPLSLATVVGPDWTSFTHAAITVAGSRAYVMLHSTQTSTQRVEVFDVSNTSAPVRLGTFSHSRPIGISSMLPYSFVGYGFPSESASTYYFSALPNIFAFDSLIDAWHLGFDGSRLFGLSGGLVTVYEPGQSILTPPAVSTFTGPGTGRDIAFSGNNAFVAAEEGGLYTINKSNPLALTRTGWMDESMGSGYLFETSPTSGWTYAVDEVGIRVISLANPALPAIVNTIHTSAVGQHLFGSTLYTTRYDGQISTWSLASPTVPTLVNATSTGFLYGTPTRIGNRLYLATASGIRILNVTTPTFPTVTATYAPIGFTTWVGTSGGMLLAKDAFDGIWVMSVSNPDSPQLLGYLSVDPGYSRDAPVVMGSRMFAADDSFFDHRIAEIDLSNPAAPFVRSRTPVNDASDARLNVSGSRLVLASAHDIIVYDAATPGELARVAQVTNPEAWFTGTTVVGTTLVATELEGGLRSYSLPTQWRPAPVEWPADIISCPHESRFITARFRANPAGMLYRWYHNGAALSDDARHAGTTSNSLLISDMTGADGGLYWCIATNSCGSSEPAETSMRLTVCVGDFDCSGGVDGDDVISFFGAWDAALPSADLTSDGSVDGDDVIAFFAAWDSGC